MHHVMSPTGVAVLLLLALAFDYFSIGPNSLGDRLAFLLGVAAIREGFDGSTLDLWTINALARGIESMKDAAGDAYIAGAATHVVLGMGVVVMFMAAVGYMLPAKASTKLGRFAAMTLPTSAVHRMNFKLWLLAAGLGLMADIPGGQGGLFIGWCIDGLVSVCATIPFMLLGVS